MRSCVMTALSIVDTSRDLRGKDQALHRRPYSQHQVAVPTTPQLGHLRLSASVTNAKRILLHSKALLRCLAWLRRIDSFATFCLSLSTRSHMRANPCCSRHSHIPMYEYTIHNQSISYCAFVMRTKTLRYLLGQLRSANISCVKTRTTLDPNAFTRACTCESQD